MIDVVKGVEPENRIRRHPPECPQIESAMPASRRIRRTKTVCTYCGVGCSFDVWSTGPPQFLKVEPADGPANGNSSTCIKGKFGWDVRQRSGPPDQAPEFRRRATSSARLAGDELSTYGARRGKISEIKRRRTGAGIHSLFIVLLENAPTKETANLIAKNMARAVVGTK